MIRRITASDLRTMYREFFEQRGHAAIASASLIPENDPSVLFTTAGMHPLVPYLMGQPHPAGTRLVDCQKCVRTGDIDEVGDSTHLTFFEMLGNWSLGDYFKRESIGWSFEFLTRPDLLGIAPERLHVSVFAGDENAPRDTEAADIWQRLGIPLERISLLPAEHNWWSAGDTGPCGPDTEIFVDTTGTPCVRGAECVAGVCKCGRFFEIWNNVFMAYERTADGQVRRLSTHNVDTGMGLERTLAVLNGAASVYETTDFLPIVDRLVAAAGTTRETVAASAEHTRALRVIADHLRTAVFILGDQRGVAPSNHGQGYVLRRLIRRAARFSERFGLDAHHWADVSTVVISTYAGFYPELRANATRVDEELHREIDRFQKALARGTRMLEDEIAALRSRGERMLPGRIAFRLFDTFGFPIELTQEAAAEKGVTVDREDFRARFEEHRAKSRTERAASGLADHSAESVRYHTATHLLHAALRQVLGPHVQQKGSHITSERMRFDFSHPKAMTRDEIAAVEKLVQDVIDRGIEVTAEVMPYEAARTTGAIGLFDDRYGNEVSVYTIGDVSKELCSGPHVANTREIGRFKIEKEQAVGAGIRRVRATVS
jgi:alanyl-tRNA synthetase